MAKTGIRQYIEFLESQEDIRDEILDNVVDALAPTALSALQRQPGTAVRPRDWQSERQRRAYFATNGFGAGIPYRRTGKLAASWEMYAKDGTIVISNPSPIAKYVYGSLAQNRAAALRFQQRAHAKTGWQQATDTVREFLDAADELFRSKYEEKVGDVVKESRRAYTSPTRRKR